MNETDLSTFFAKEVPHAQPGDDQVHRFVGVPYHDGVGVEAELDIQFMMGVAPGVKTEFWEWPERDFCADLHNYTHTLLKPSGPLVNSISYGWQGDLSKVGCTSDLVGIIDINWVWPPLRLHRHTHVHARAHAHACAYICMGERPRSGRAVGPHRARLVCTPHLRHACASPRPLPLPLPCRLTSRLRSHPAAPRPAPRPACGHRPSSRPLASPS